MPDRPLIALCAGLLLGAALACIILLQAAANRPAAPQEVPTRIGTPLQVCALGDGRVVEC